MPFKIRRDLLLNQAACIAGSVNIGGNVAMAGTLNVTSDTTVGGTLTQTGTISTTACAVIGTNGTSLAKVIAGSLAVTAPSLAASTADTVAACIAGLGTSGADFKIFPIQYAGGACIVLVGIAPSANSPEGVVTLKFFNAGGADDANTTATSLYYLGVLDK